MNFRGYRLKEATINGVQMWAVVKYCFWGLIEGWTMWASVSIAQAEKMRMELEIKQNKKK